MLLVMLFLMLFLCKFQPHEFWIWLNMFFSVWVNILKLLSYCLLKLVLKVHSLQFIWFSLRVCKPLWFPQCSRKSSALWSTPWRDWHFSTGELCLLLIPFPSWFDFTYIMVLPPFQFVCPIFFFSVFQKNISFLF